RAAAVAPLRPGGLSVVHVGDLPEGAHPRAAGGDPEVLRPLLRRRDGEAALGGALHGIAQLEPPGAAGHRGESRDLLLRLRDYDGQGSEKAFTFSGNPDKKDGKEVMAWLYTHDNPYYPKNNRPNVWARDLETGKVVWHKDFSEYGFGGNDTGLCVMDGKLYYSNFFGYAAALRKARGLPEGPNGITMCLDPASGEILWKTTK